MNVHYCYFCNIALTDGYENNQVFSRRVVVVLHDNLVYQWIMGHRNFHDIGKHRFGFGMFQKYTFDRCLLLHATSKFGKSQIMAFKN